MQQNSKIEIHWLDSGVIEVNYTNMNVSMMRDAINALVDHFINKTTNKNESNT